MTQNLNFPTVIQLLENRKSDKNNKTITHTALGEPKLNIYPGKYNIKDDDKESFLKLYTKWIFQWGESLHLTEAHDNDKSPVLIDLDFRYENDDSEERKYSNKDILFFINEYFSVLDKYLNIPEDKKETFILEKSKPVVDSKNKEIMKDGVHIIMPYIVSNYNVLHLVRHEIINNSEVSDRFESLGFKNPIEDIVDKAVIQRNNWFMYGSTKPGKEAYLVSSIIYCIDGEYKITKGKKEYTNEQLVKILGINNNLDINNAQLNLPEDEILSKYEKFFGTQKKKTVVKSEEDIKQTTESLDLIKQVVSILSPRRADSYEEWIKLGWCLHNIHNIDNSLLDAWVEFSMKSNKFVFGECEKRWEEMKDEGGLGIGTLYRWAKLDNLNEFNRIMSDDVENLIKASLSKCHYDIAKVIHKLYKHEFKCVSNKKWYQFKNHKWNFIGDGTEIKRKISEDIVAKFCAYAGKCNQIIQQLTDETQQETYIKRGKTAFEISSKLKDVPFKKNILECCSELFHQRDFADTLDSNVDLIGFKNGVYDLKAREFREGYPDDNIFFSTGINYKTFEENDPLIKQVKEFVSQVLVDRSPLPLDGPGETKNPDRVRTYVLKVMASMLSGKTGEEKFHIWTGCGGNGKSKIIELFEMAFGDYCGKMPVTVLTRPRGNSGDASPELVKNKGKRFVTLQEPDDNEKIHVGAMKELTGGDKIQARGLFQDPIEFKPQWKIVMTSNVLPEVSANDNGTWRRIRVTEYISRFVNPNDIKPDKKKNVFPIDYDLSTKLKAWPEAFMYILINYYHDYIDNGNPEPYEVIKAAEDYKKQSDIFLQFITDNITESPTEKLSIDEIYNLFREWYKLSGHGGKLPLRKDLENNITQQYGKPIKGKWKGITTIDANQNEDDDEDDDDY